MSLTQPVEDDSQSGSCNLQKGPSPAIRLRSRVEAAILSGLETPKRDSAAGLSSVDAWYPYHAGFSFQYAREVLRVADLGERDVVLDPWNGSGTTTAAAASLKIPSIGVDLSPFAIAMARAKLAWFRSSDSLLKRADRILGTVPRGYRAPAGDPLLSWLDPDTVQRFRALQGAIREAGRFDPVHLKYNRSALFDLCLFRGSRDLVVARYSNPTWQKRPGVPVRITQECLVEVFRRAVSAIAAEYKAPPSEPLANLLLADSRFPASAPASVSLVLTSPPYCTRIDYVKKTLFELAAVGPSEPGHESVLRESMMGTTKIRNSATNLDGMPTEIIELLNCIRRHPSHGSPGYYYKTFAQYFADARQALAALHRTLRPHGVAVLILQDSYYKEIHVDLADLFLVLGRSVGLVGNIVKRYPVRLSYTRLNSAAKKYRRRHEYSESAVVLEKECEYGR